MKTHFVTFLFSCHILLLLSCAKSNPPPTPATQQEVPSSPNRLLEFSNEDWVVRIDRSAEEIQIEVTPQPKGKGCCWDWPTFHRYLNKDWEWLRRSKSLRILDGKAGHDFTFGQPSEINNLGQPDAIPIRLTVSFLVNGKITYLDIGWRDGKIREGTIEAGEVPQGEVE